MSRSDATLINVEFLILKQVDGERSRCVIYHSVERNEKSPVMHTDLHCSATSAREILGLFDGYQDIEKLWIQPSLNFKEWAGAIFFKKSYRVFSSLYNAHQKTPCSH